MLALTAHRAKVGTAAALGALCAVLAASPTPALAKAPKRESPEHALVHWINVQRQHAGVAPLAPWADLTVLAHRHTAHMAKRDRVLHDPYLGSEVHHWTRVGEDVGRGASLADLEKALLSTADNRVNLLDAGFRHVGVGVKGQNGLLYMTVITRRPDSPPHH